MVLDGLRFANGVARGSDGLIWVSLASPRDPLVERLQRGPQLLRASVTKIPEALQPKPKRTVRAQAYDDAGRLVHDVDVATDRYHMVTGVREHDGRLWLGSLHEPAIAVVGLWTRRIRGGRSPSPARPVSSGPRRRGRRRCRRPG